MQGPDKVYEHESYGVFGISRVSGTTYLFDSEALHHSYIRLRVAPAKMERSLNNEWIHASGQPYIEVDISYSAFFRGIASPGVGEGVPCTVRYLNGKRLAEPPQPETAESKFGDDIKRTLAQTTKTLDDLTGKLTEALLPGNKPLNKTELKSLLGGLQDALRGIKSNLPFVEESFNEHMENKTQALKTELEGLRDHMLLQLGHLAAADRIRREGLPEFSANAPELPAGPNLLREGGGE
jgi:hypothetical protein